MMRSALAAEYGGSMSLRAWWDRWGDWIVALALCAGAQYEVWTGNSFRPWRGLDTVAFALVTLPLAWRRRAPVAVLAFMTAVLVYGTLFVTEPDQAPVEPFLAFIVAFYSVGANAPERRSVIVAAASLAAIAAATEIRTLYHANVSARPGAWLVLGVAWLIGRDLRRRRRQAADLRTRAALAEREREEKARVAVAEERSRIARELHDVVAHSVSVMVVQAQAGPRLLGDPEQAQAAFRSIEGSGREALVELRRLLGILRMPDEQAAIGPQPGLGSLGSLVDQVREAGLPVAVHVEGEQVPLPRGIDLSAYRIVQEALTNTLKHAGTARAEIVVRYGRSAVEVEVSDDGQGAQNGANGTGHGLIGMRERVALYGGTLRTGTRPGGGYEVRARLPLTGAGG
jgi:signal transduction histidine kinase